MGSIILIVAFVVEAGFAAYCILTKSNQNKAKNFIRVGALGAFVLLALVSVIQWGALWYLLALLLLLWGALGALALIRRRADPKAFKAGPVVGRALGTLLLVFIALTPALIFPQHKPPKVTGTHAVATATFTYTDPDRIETYSKTGENRFVNVEFWYPADATGAEKYPLVVFSHGSLGVKISNTSTFMELASNGYVVCSIDHPYHAAFTRGPNGQMVLVAPSFRQELYDVNGGKYDAATTFAIEQNWVNVQAGDINFVLDTILAQAKDPASAAVYHLVDGQKIGLMGHSLGGASSAQVARMRVASGQNDISAVVNLDSNPFGEYTGVVNGQEVLNKSPYPVPLLTILTEDTKKRIDAVPNANEVVAVQYISTTNPLAYEIVLPGTNHMSVTDMPLISPILTTLMNGSVGSTRGSGADPLATIERMNATVLQFFNVYLKGEGSFSVSGSD